VARDFVLRTDGGARGNPGPAGIGFVLEDLSGAVVAEGAEGIGWATNNVAEYRALIAGLQTALERGVERLEVVMDSTLVVNQMKGGFRVKHPGLKPLHSQARDLAKRFERIAFKAVPRSENFKADKLVNEAIDKWVARNPGARAPDSDSHSSQRGLF
jgi:ribonuclease H / adenosylcobalamin/alpha-ribazole phosphatase